MIALDTNVLARALIDDPAAPAQSDAVRKRLARETQLFVPAVVQAELVWVLETAFELNKSEVLALLDHLHVNRAYLLESEPAFTAALTQFRSSAAGFADCLILASARIREAALLTFDRKLGRLPGTQLLAP
ncbi:PIN domain-containing protein [Nevskia sp.]|uniref:PIN domain-containing protein n=1 Tax=Nevskia sp. TaxID=1929292 RepID=UPI0025F7927D|nr:type II toxin-antitoxin system VapC family toxin [Nevskia sp.]